ncbi:Collagen alpha-1(XVI) chain [Myotis brandtii]|uniref:Collagen alpha-1(XVI) chain n=1 Tax=Myotis brandtii TaxID=109478 RepID=S7PW51_MYOBR|nr:Collagen alpha-1(XVI) chain [Myotis brandtii]
MGQRISTSVRNLGPLPWGDSPIAAAVEYSDNLSGEKCPPSQQEGLKLEHRSDLSTNVTGFNLIRRLNFMKTSAIKKIRNPNGPLILRLGATPLTQPTRRVFPRGLPDEFTLVLTLLLKKHTHQNTWYLFQVTDGEGYPQISLEVNSQEQSLELRALGHDGDFVSCIFSVPQLFDLHWHKLQLSVAERVASVHVDCTSASSQPLGPRRPVRPVGHVFLGLDAEQAKPVSFDLQQAHIYCDPELVLEEGCCEILPGGPFPHTGQCPPETSKARRDTQSNELIEINPQTEGKVYTRCFCLEEPQSSKCPPCVHGARESNGNDCVRISPDAPLQGDPGIQGLKGEKGESCLSCSPAVGAQQLGPLAGIKGDVGPPGLGFPGLPGEPCEPCSALSEPQNGNSRVAALPGPPGEKGEPGPPGFGLPGKQVPRGQPAPAGSPLPSLIPTPYRVTQGILETPERQAPWGSRDCRESQGFGAPWGQKEKRSGRWWAVCCMNTKRLRVLRGRLGSGCEPPLLPERWVGAPQLFSGAGVSGACCDFPRLRWGQGRNRALRGTHGPPFPMPPAGPAASPGSLLAMPVSD